MRNIVAFVFLMLLSLPAMSGGIFDYCSGEAGRKACIRLPKGGKHVRAILYCHQNMTEEVLFRSPVFTGRMDSLGVAMAFVQSGSQNWDVSTGCGERFDSIMADFACGTRHPEILSAPVIPFGHSAQATFPWNFAAWNPDRTLCVISFHGDAPRTNLCGYGRANIEWGRTRNIDSIAGLMVMGEYEWWEARLRPALAFRMMYPESRISLLCDTGRGHFDMSEETMLYIAAFIEKSLANPRPSGGTMLSRWFADGSVSEDPHEMFWYHDEEMAAMTRRRHEAHTGKRMQYVSARIDGAIVPYDTTAHIKLSATVPGRTIRIEPVFTDETRTAVSGEHAPTKLRVVLISGPAVRVDEYTFEYDPDYFGADPRRLWSGITFCIEADGDSIYKPAVQELNIRLR